VEVDDLRRRLDALVRPHVRVPQVQPRPTSHSLVAIERHFGIRLPAELVELARSSDFFSMRFLSLGTDTQSPQHIIRNNSYWRQRRRTRRVPASLVLFTHGHDDEYWALDAARTKDGDALPVQFWCPDEITYCSDDRPTQRYSSFLEWLRAEVHWGEFHADNRKRKP
jgi:hypothetical protein